MGEKRTVELTAKGTGGSASLTVINEIKACLAESLEDAGMPRKIWLYVSPHQLDAKTVNEAGMSEVEGNAIPSVKNGRIMYNFGGKFVLAETEVRIGGNVFLPADGFTVDSKNLADYRQAKYQRATELKRQGKPAEDADAVEA